MLLMWQEMEPTERARFMRDWFLFGDAEKAFFIARDRQHRQTGVDW